MAYGKKMNAAEMAMMKAKGKAKAKPKAKAKIKKMGKKK